MVRNVLKIATAAAAFTLAATAHAAQGPAAVAQGSYECWGNGSPRLLMNFKVVGKDRYTDADGKEKGTFSYNPATGAITFKGGHLDGVMPPGFTSIYHEPRNKPTVSFRGKSGAEAQYCERAGK